MDEGIDIPAEGWGLESEWPDMLLPDGSLDVDAMLERRKTEPRKPVYMWEISGEAFTDCNGERITSVEGHLPMSPELLAHHKVEAEKLAEDRWATFEHRRRFERGVLTRSGIKKIKKPEYLIDGLLQKDTLALVVGPTQVGKTFVMIDMLLSAGAGVPWRGKYETKKCRGLYIVAEGAGAFGQRIQAWDEQHPELEAQSEEMRFETEPPNMFDAQDFKDFLPVAVRFKPDIIVFDTWAKTTAGANEDKAQDTAIIYGRADELRRATGACVVFIHHTGHVENGRARGSSNLEASADTVLVLSGTPTNTVLTIKKQKDGEDDRQITMARKTVNLNEGGTSCVIVNPGEVSAAEAKLKQIPRRKAELLRVLLEIQNQGRVVRASWLKAAGGKNGNQHDSDTKWLVDNGIVDRIQEEGERSAEFRSEWEDGDGGWTMIQEEL